MIGVDDDGSIVGVKDPKSLMKKISDTVANKLAIYPEVDVDETTRVVSVTVRKTSVPVELDGKFYIRTGNTIHAAEGREYDLLISKRTGIAWSDLPMEGISVNDLDPYAIDYFRKKAIKKGNLSRESLDIPDVDLLRKLGLLAQNGSVTRAAVLLFHREPGELIIGSFAKIGRFEGTNGSEILYQDIVGGPLIYMPEKVCDLIGTKYSIRAISYDGLNMVERFPFPHESLREAIINAIMHNHYGSNIPIQIRIWDDRIRIADQGGIPDGWTEETLIGDHESRPTNPTMANVFFLAGFEEGWGRGIRRMIDGYDGYPGMSPRFEVSRYSFTVTLDNINHRNDAASKGTSRIDNDGDLLTFLDTPGGRSPAEISEFLGIRKTGVSRALAPMLEKGLVERTVPNAPRSRNQRYRTTKKANDD